MAATDGDLAQWDEARKKWVRVQNPTFPGDLKLLDNEALILGTGEDAKIYYDGTDLIIDPDVVGSGKVKIGGDLDVVAGDIYMDDQQWIGFSSSLVRWVFDVGTGTMELEDADLDLKNNNITGGGQITTANAFIGTAPNQTEITTTGDTIFNGSAGLCYGEIYVKDNAGSTTLNSAAKVQVTDFDTDGEENNVDADHTNDHLLIQKEGRYFITVSLTVANAAAQSHVLVLSCYKNNGASEFNNIHAHRSLTGGSGDVASVSMNGIADFAVNDTLELWATTDAAADRDVIFQDITMSIVQIGG